MAKRKSIREKIDATETSHRGPTGHNAHVIAWGDAQIQRGVHFLLVLECQEAATALSVLGKSLKEPIDHMVKLNPAFPNNDTWLMMYRRGDRFAERLMNQFGAPGGIGAWLDVDEASEDRPGSEFRQLMVGWHQLAKLPAKLLEEAWRSLTPLEMKELLLESEKRRAKCIATQREMLSKKEAPLAGTKEQYTPELQFFVRVWWPCLILYGVDPGTLYNLAVEADLSAIEKLLVLDTRLDQDRRISALFQHWKDTQFEPGLEIIRKCCGSTKYKQTTEQALTIRAMAMLLESAAQLQNALSSRWPVTKLTLKDLRDLFDAAARDQELLVNEFLPAAPEALRKAVDRARKGICISSWDIFSKKRVA